MRSIAHLLFLLRLAYRNLRYFTSPRFPPRRYPEGFQGNAIPVDGEVVARLCVDRILLKIEPDD